ncbi:hypothetical protein F4809DRAFT_600553 [Biscogniauxia mediterranea]|nr:hypothetical protein F4809DRAFT_600553 [Biscogniauxia mediterranea]
MNTFPSSLRCTLLRGLWVSRCSALRFLVLMEEDLSSARSSSSLINWGSFSGLIMLSFSSRSLSAFRCWYSTRSFSRVLCFWSVCLL